MCLVVDIFSADEVVNDWSVWTNRELLGLLVVFGLAVLSQASPPAGVASKVKEVLHSHPHSKAHAKTLGTVKPVIDSANSVDEMRALVKAEDKPEFRNVLQALTKLLQVSPKGFKLFVDG